MLVGNIGWVPLPGLEPAIPVLQEPKDIIFPDSWATAAFVIFKGKSFYL